MKLHLSWFTLFTGVIFLAIDGQLDLPLLNWIDIFSINRRYCYSVSNATNITKYLFSLSNSSYKFSCLCYRIFWNLDWFCNPPSTGGQHSLFSDLIEAENGSSGCFSFISGWFRVPASRHMAFIHSLPRCSIKSMKRRRRRGLTIRRKIAKTSSHPSLVRLLANFRAAKVM